MEVHTTRFCSTNEPHLLVLVKDITNRKRAEAALERSERLQQAILDHIPDPVWLKDGHGRFLACNEPLARFFGYTKDAMLGKTIHDLVLPKAAQFAREHSAALRSRRPIQVEETVADHQGRISHFETVRCPVYDGRGKVAGTVGLARDITERKRAEELLRELPRRIIAAQEAERLRVARELHDGINQLIASANMRLQRIMTHQGRLNPVTHEMLARCSNLLVQAMEESRRVAHNLRPSDLDSFGFAVACRTLCQQPTYRILAAVSITIA